MIRTVPVMMHRVNPAEHFVMHLARLLPGLFVWHSRRSHWRNPAGRVARVVIAIPAICQRSRRQVPTHVRVVVALAVEVQACLRVKVMSLEAQRLLKDFVRVAIEPGKSAVGGVLGSPHDLAAGISELLRRAQVIELVIIGASLGGALAVEHHQRAKGAWFVQVTAVMLRAAFGDEGVAVPDKHSALAIDGLADPATKGVVAISHVDTTGQGDADQAVLAVITVFGHQHRRAAPAFADEVAEGIVSVVAVTLLEQAMGFERDRSRTVEH